MAKKRAKKRATSKKGCKCPKGAKRTARGSCYIRKADGRYRFVAKVCKGKRGGGARKRKCPKGCKKG